LSFKSLEKALASLRGQARSRRAGRRSVVLEKGPRNAEDPRRRERAIELLGAIANAETIKVPAPRGGYVFDGDDAIVVERVVNHVLIGRSTRTS